MYEQEKQDHPVGSYVYDRDKKRAECRADTARVVQIINSLDNVKPDGDAVSRYELLQAIEEAIRDD